MEYYFKKVRLLLLTFSIHTIPHNFTSLFNMVLLLHMAVDFDNIFVNRLLFITGPITNFIGECKIREGYNINVHNLLGRVDDCLSPAFSGHFHLSNEKHQSGKPLAHTAYYADALAQKLDTLPHVSPCVDN